MNWGKRTLRHRTGFNNPKKLSRVREKISYLESHRMMNMVIDLPISVTNDNYDSFVRDRCKFIKDNMKMYNYSDSENKEHIAIKFDELQRFLTKPVNGTYAAFLLSVSKQMNQNRLIAVEPDWYTILLDAPRLFWFEYPEVERLTVRTINFNEE